MQHSDVCTSTYQRIGVKLKPAFSDEAPWSTRHLPHGGQRRGNNSVTENGTTRNRTIAEKFSSEPGGSGPLGLWNREPGPGHRAIRHRAPRSRRSSVKATPGPFRSAPAHATARRRRGPSPHHRHLGTPFAGERGHHEICATSSPGRARRGRIVATSPLKAARRLRRGSPALLHLHRTAQHPAGRRPADARDRGSTSPWTPCTAPQPSSPIRPAMAALTSKSAASDRPHKDEV